MFKTLIVRFDAALTVAITGWPQWLRTPFLGITFIGQPACLIAIAIVVAATNISNTPIVACIAAALIAMSINTFVKHFIHRPRPDTLYVNSMYFKSSSFPSGHAFGSVVVLGLFALVLAAHGGAWGLAGAGLLGVLIASIGLSRIYLGAHYPTDVLAGWLFGGALLWIIIGSIQP